MTLLGVDLFEAEVTHLIALTAHLAACESPSGNLPALARLSQVLQAELATCHAHCTVLPDAQAGDTLLATWGRDVTGGVLLLCHYDTVHPLGTLTHQPI